MPTENDKELMNTACHHLQLNNAAHDWYWDGSQVVVIDMTHVPASEIEFDTVMEAAKFLYGKLFDLNR